MDGITGVSAIINDRRIVVTAKDKVSIKRKVGGQEEWSYQELEPNEVFQRATVLENGNVLIEIINENSPDESKVIEINRRNGEIVWQYILPPQVNEWGISDADRLANGNTLVLSSGLEGEPIPPNYFNFIREINANGEEISLTKVGSYENNAYEIAPLFNGNFLLSTHSLVGEFSKRTGESGWEIGWTEPELRTQALDSDVIENGSILILRKSYFTSPEEMIIDQVDGEKNTLKEFRIPSLIDPGNPSVYIGAGGIDSLPGGNWVIAFGPRLLQVNSKTGEILAEEKSETDNYYRDVKLVTTRE